MLLGVQESGRGWTFTLPNELPLWELGSRCTPESLENNCRGQTHWIEKFLISLEISWNENVWNGLAWPIWTFKIQVMAKRRVGSQIGNLTLDHFWPLEVRNLPDFLAWRWCATYRWKALDEGYNFVLDFISIRGLHAKLWTPKVVQIPVVGISRFPLGSLGTKWHLSVGLVARHREYYKGEGGGFPQVQAVVSLVSPCLPMARSCTKVFQLRTNQLIVWFVQICVSKWNACQSS